MNKKEIFNNKVNNKGERKMNIIEQHQAFYNQKAKDEEKEMQEILKSFWERVHSDNEKLLERFVKEFQEPSKEIQTINNAIETDTTGKSRSEIICNVIKEIADKNYEEIEKIQKENPNCELYAVRTNVDECKMIVKADGFFLHEVDTKTTIQKLKDCIKNGIDDIMPNVAYIDMEDKISEEEQKEIIEKIEKDFKNTIYDYIKIISIPKIDKWVIIDTRDNKVKFIDTPPKVNKIMQILKMELS